MMILQKKCFGSVALAFRVFICPLGIRCNSPESVVLADFLKRPEQEETEKTEWVFFLRFLCFLLLN